MEFQQLSVSCNISTTAVEDALQLIGYRLPRITLHVSNTIYFEAVRLIRQMDPKDNPFCPLVNVNVDHSLPAGTWVVDVDDVRAGSKGF